MILASKLVRTRRGRPRKVRSGVVVAYLRVSTDDQDTGLAAQQEQVERYIAAHDLDLAKMVVDSGTSGGAPVDERPVLWEAIAAARDYHAQIFLVAKRDRLARDLFASLLIERHLESLGVRIESADGSGNGQTPEAELLRSVLHAIAAYERALIRGRTKAAKAVLRRQGLSLGGTAQYGTRIGEDGALWPNDDEEAIIDRIKKERKAGLTFKQIVDGLERDGVPARGERWHIKTVHRIARRK